MRWWAHVRIKAQDGHRNPDFTNYAYDEDRIHDILWMYRAPSGAQDPVYCRFFWSAERGMWDEEFEHPRGKFL